MTTASRSELPGGSSAELGGRDNQGGWLVGPTTDLLLGCGLGSIAVSVLMAFQGDWVATIVPGALLVLVFSLPHYGATILRVYETQEDRRRYALFAFGATALLGAGFVVGLESVLFGSILLTVYLTWSPWHYTGQNYGIFLILAGRRAIPVGALTKRLVYASFILSYGLTFLAIHGIDRPADYAPVSYAGTVYQLLPLGIPFWVSKPLFWVLAAGYGGTVAAWLVSLWRVSSLRQLGPSLVVAATQSLWFSVPVVLRFAGLSESGSPMAGIYDAYGFLWIAAAHAVQYLWITTYYARKSGRASAPFPYLARTAAAGFAIWTVPVLIFAPGVLGSLPHEAGLAVLVAAVVNIHHFILDGVVWKLRDGRVARVLLREARDPELNVGGTLARRWPKRVLWATGGVCIVVGLGALWEEGALRTALGVQDTVRARTAMDRLSWLGRDGPKARTRLGRLYAKKGQSRQAEREFRHSLALHPTVDAWRSLGLLGEEARDWDAVVRSYDGLLAMEPDDGQALYRRGLAHLERGEPQNALDDIDRAATLHPDEAIIGLSRQRAQRMLDASSAEKEGGQSAAPPAPRLGAGS